MSYAYARDCWDLRRRRDAVGRRVCALGLRHPAADATLWIVAQQPEQRPGEQPRRAQVPASPYGRLLAQRSLGTLQHHVPPSAQRVDRRVVERHTDVRAHAALARGVALDLYREIRIQ